MVKNQKINKNKSVGQIKSPLRTLRYTRTVRQYESMSKTYTTHYTLHTFLKLNLKHDLFFVYYTRNPAGIHDDVAQPLAADSLLNYSHA